MRNCDHLKAEESVGEICPEGKGSGIAVTWSSELTSAVDSLLVKFRQLLFREKCKFEECRSIIDPTMENRSGASSIGHEYPTVSDEDDGTPCFCYDRAVVRVPMTDVR